MSAGLWTWEADDQIARRTLALAIYRLQEAAAAGVLCKWGSQVLGPIDDAIRQAEFALRIVDGT